MSSVMRTILLLLSGVLILTITACDKDFNTLGIGTVDNQQIETGIAYAEVFAFNKKTNPVRTDGLDIYQLGSYNDLVYGRTNSVINSQLSLPANNPIFGRLSQEDEDKFPDPNNPQFIQEEETVTNVYLDIPFFNSQDDADGDGVLDDDDIDPNDRESDTDGDGVPDVEETINGTDPLDPDTDDDGIGDAEDTDNSNPQNDVRNYQLDSIIGNREAFFDLRVDELTFFLRQLDPNAGFEEAQEYFSDQDFIAEGFAGELLANEIQYQIDEEEIRIYDDSMNVIERFTPRIRIALDNDFFQTRIIDIEGQQELSNNDVFVEYLRGLIISTSNFSDDLLMIFDLGQAEVRIEYEYRSYNDNDTPDDDSDDFIETLDDDYSLSLGPIITNTFKNDPYPSFINNAITSSENGENAEKIYLKGGEGVFTEIRLFDKEEGDTMNLAEIKANNWLINDVLLTFHIDSETLNSLGDVIEPPRIYLFDVERDLVIADYFFDGTSSGNNTLDSKVVYGGVIELDENNRGSEYSLRVTDHVTNILRRDSTNVRLGLAVTSNIFDVSPRTIKDDEDRLPNGTIVNPFGTILFGSETTHEEKKLQLQIFYTETNTN